MLPTTLQLYYILFCLEGYYRLVSFESEVQSLTLMLDLFDANCWELNEVDKEVTYEALKEFIPKPVFDILFAKYTEVSNKSKEDATPLHRYLNFFSEYKIYISISYCYDKV